MSENETITPTAQLWTVDARRLRPDVAKQVLRPLLDAQEARQLKVLEPELKHPYLVAHALMRAVVGGFTQTPPAKVRFRRRRFGKLLVENNVSPVHFNLTHTRDFAAVLISDVGPAGVDAEQTDRPIDPEQIAKHFGSPMMRRELEAVPPLRRSAWLYRQWVLHEALLKAAGIGLADRVPLRPMPLDAATHSGIAGKYQLQLFELSASTIAATAIRSPSPVQIEICDGERLLEAGIAVVD